MNPLDLPVNQQRERILEALAGHQAIVIESPTGSGKTTQVPQILYHAGYAEKGLIGVTQPRRIAAISVSRFIARQLGRTVPDTIGYKMRFEDRTDERTRIKIMTDGILLQEMKADYHLSRYGVIMVDEAHERSLNIDFILGLLKRVLRERPGFKVIVSSATINAEVFFEYFDECPVVKIEAVTYPVEVIHDPPEIEGDYDQLLQKVEDIVDATAKKGESGDILIFLPGEKAIKDCSARLQALPGSRDFEILPLYARLAAEEQERVFADTPGKRKVIVATNIAETSVTIDGVRTVIDPGSAKLSFYNQRTFTSSLVEVPISKASCNQRRGRAGRTAPGVCYRLYSQQEYELRELFTREEILRTDLSEVVLRMAELGITDFENFEFLAVPDREGILSAIQTLKLLDAIDEQRRLTRVGEMMCRFPLLPKHARMIVEAILHYPNVLEETVTAAAFLSADSPFLLPLGEEMAARRAHHSFRDAYGDFVSYLKILQGYLRSGNRQTFCDRAYLDSQAMAEIANVKEQLELIVSDMGVPVLAGGDVSDYLCAVSRGLIQFVCGQAKRGVYRTLTAGRIMIHPGSVLFGETPPYIVAGEIVRTTRMYARSVSKLRPEWLKRTSPLLYEGLVLRRPVTEKLGAAAARDFTNNVRIGSLMFPIRGVKGKKKLVTLEWERLAPVLHEIDRSLLAQYRKMRGTLLYDGWEIMGGAPLDSLLAAAAKMDLEHGVLRKWSNRNYTASGSADELCEELGRLLRLCRLQKKNRRLGFLALLTDRAGVYWLEVAKSFHSALAQSLGSLEALADEVSDGDKGRPTECINAAYRRLSKLIEE